MQPLELALVRSGRDEADEEAASAVHRQGRPGLLQQHLQGGQRVLDVRLRDFLGRPPRPPWLHEAHDPSVHSLEEAKQAGSRSREVRRL